MHRPFCATLKLVNKSLSLFTQGLLYSFRKKAQWKKGRLLFRGKGGKEVEGEKVAAGILPLFASQPIRCKEELLLPLLLSKEVMAVEAHSKFSPSSTGSFSLSLSFSLTHALSLASSFPFLFLIVHVQKGLSMELSGSCRVACACV